jgi:hypothetical protein
VSAHPDLVAEPRAGFLPLALRAPQVLVLHAVDLPALLRLAADAARRVRHLPQGDRDHAYVGRVVGLKRPWRRFELLAGCALLFRDRT